jgi:AraC-like DNA-binding protein
MTGAQAISFEHWQDTVRTVCGPMESQAAAEVPFDGRVMLRRVSDFSMIEHHATVDELHWDRRHIAQITSPYCYVILQLGAGRLRVVQQDDEVALSTGDWTVVDSLRPASFRFQDDMHILALNLPRDLVTMWARGRDVPYTAHASAATGAGAVFSTYARSLFEHAASLDPEDLRHREAVLDLLFASLPGRFDARARNRERQLDRVLRYVDANLSDPGLSPRSIADAVGMSTRHLHRIFRDHDVSLGEWILKRRLQNARCDLADERLSANRVLDIAVSWGFKDAAHFSRAFSATFGLTPRDYRNLIRVAAGRN